MSQIVSLFKEDIVKPEKMNPLNSLILKIKSEEEQIRKLVAEEQKEDGENWKLMN